MVPAGQSSWLHRNVDPGGTYVPDGHETQGVAGFESSSVKPAGQSVQFPEWPVPAYVPGAHSAHGVVGSESWSVSPERHLSSTQVRVEPAGE